MVSEKYVDHHPGAHQKIERSSHYHLTIVADADFGFLDAYMCEIDARLVGA
jgi:hypothetical protein